jgi:hypothetical protein
MTWCLQVTNRVTPWLKSCPETVFFMCMFFGFELVFIVFADYLEEYWYASRVLFIILLESPITCGDDIDMN